MSAISCTNFSDIYSKNNLPKNISLIASHYIQNPLLLETLNLSRDIGWVKSVKFDLRIYVAISSVYPLRFYIYEEGLVWFATVKYELCDVKDFSKSKFMHLTNYSVNKGRGEEVKWKLSQLWDLIEDCVEVPKLKWRIDDIIIKTILSVEDQLKYAFEQKVPHRGNCFQLLGFDILIDSYLKPWLLEVN